MRILIITALYPDDSPIEVTNAIHDLVRFWTDSHEVICFKEDWIYAPHIFRRGNLIEQIKLLKDYQYCERDKVRIYRFTGIANLFARFNIHFWGIFEKNMVKKMNKVLGFIEKPDIVIAHMPVLNVVDYIKYLKIDCPKIAVLHRSDTDWLDSDRWGKGVVRRKINLINDQFDAVFSRSHSIYRQLLELGKINSLKEVIISSGVPQCEEYHEKDWNAWNVRKKSILYVGKLIKQKGVDVILESLNNISKDYAFELTIIGEGEELENLQSLIKKLHLEEYVVIAGKRSREEVYEYMSKADIFVMPARHETLGLVYLEAMANGCITIGSKEEGIDGILLNGENGFLVKALDVKELTECLESIMKMDSSDLRQISQNAKATADRYTPKERSDIYLQKVIEVSGKVPV